MREPAQSRTRLRRQLGAAVAAFAAASVGRGRLEELQPGGAERWTRRNHRGEPISLLAGPALTLGLLAGSAQDRASASRMGGLLGSVVAVGGAGTFGLIDDLAEDSEDRAKGLAGHLRALQQGRVTTGALKVLGIGASAAGAAVLLTSRRGSRRGHLLDVAINTTLIAGSANLMNLLDLRPGRALKAGVLGAVALGPAGAEATVGSVLGAAGALFEADLAERDMLGDCGANALGACLGAGAVAASRSVRVAVVSGVIALTLASERISFSAVIERQPVLRAIDRIGRRR